jgi:hypothetical protein
MTLQEGDGERSAQRMSHCFYSGARGHLDYGFPDDLVRPLADIVADLTAIASRPMTTS